MIAFIFETIAFYCSQFVFVPIYGFCIAFCWLIIAFVKDIRNDLDQLTLNDRHQNHEQITGIFCEIIELYSEVKQLSSINMFFITTIEYNFNAFSFQYGRRFQWNL